MAGTVQTVFIEPQLWDGTSLNMTWSGYITIWCFVVPTVPWIVKCGTTDTKIQQKLNLNSAAVNDVVDIIDQVGRYTVPGNCWVELANGAGGTFYISGGL